MRIIGAILQDVKFQFRYGFYFIYAVMIAFYIVILGFFPAAWKPQATAIVIFADPAALGFFFIGGILLLEKGERVLDALFVSPLRVWEYVVAKAVSLGIISAVVGIIISFAGLGLKFNLPLTALSLFIGSGLFTFAGMAAGCKAKSVNQYLIITTPVEIVLSLPPCLVLFGVRSPVLEAMPGSLLLRLVQAGAGISIPAKPLILLGALILWCIPALYLAVMRMNRFLSKIGGEAYAKNS